MGSVVGGEELCWWLNKLASGAVANVVAEGIGREWVACGTTQLGERENFEWSGGAAEVKGSEEKEIPDLVSASESEMSVTMGFAVFLVELRLSSHQRERVWKVKRKVESRYLSVWASHTEASPARGLLL